MAKPRFLAPNSIQQIMLPLYYIQVLADVGLTSLLLATT
jgi:hypothetical protein